MWNNIKKCEIILNTDNYIKTVDIHISIHTIKFVDRIYYYRLFPGIIFVSSLLGGRSKYISMCYTFIPLYLLYSPILNTCCVVIFVKFVKLYLKLTIENIST